MPLTIEVYIQPPEPYVLADSAVVVLDILRATTVHAALFEGGSRAVYPVADFARGCELRDALFDHNLDCYLIGEVDALPPPEADYGNSPTQFVSLGPRDWILVHVTSNGTRALARSTEAVLALSGSLRNRDAACRALLAADLDRINIVCSGDHGGTAPSVEDTVAAGAFVERLTSLAPQADLRGGARLARKLWQDYGRDPSRAFDDSPHADHLRRLGFHADLDYAAALDVDPTVIRLTTDDSGRVVLERVPAVAH